MPSYNQEIKSGKKSNRDWNCVLHGLRVLYYSSEIIHNLKIDSFDNYNILCKLFLDKYVGEMKSIRFATIEAVKGNIHVSFALIVLNNCLL